MTIPPDDSGALSDVRVLDLGHVVAAPFAGSLLGDLGADVIKIENPRTDGDSLRTMGPKAAGVPLWWKVAGRNKRSVAIDLNTAPGRDLLLRLVERCDVLIENFRAGRLEKWGLGPAILHEANPGLIILRISGYGQGTDGAGRPGFGRVGEAMSGATNLTGESGGRPLHVGFSLGDATTGLMGAFGVLAALRARARTGIGDVIDLALFEPLFRMIEWQLPLEEKLGETVTRSGNHFPFGYAVGGAFLTADDAWITISGATPKSIEQILLLVGGSELMNDPRFREPAGRAVRGSMVEIDHAIATWIRMRTASDVITTFGDCDIAVNYVFDAQRMLADAFFHQRGAIVDIEDADLGRMSMPGVIPRLATHPGRVRWAGPALGAHTKEVLAELLHLPDEAIERLRLDGVVR